MMAYGLAGYDGERGADICTHTGLNNSITTYITGDPHLFPASCVKLPSKKMPLEIILFLMNMKWWKWQSLSQISSKASQNK